MRQITQFLSIMNTLGNCFLPKSGLKTTLFVLKIYTRGLLEKSKKRKSFADGKSNEIYSRNCS
jgi:hypothetical protein